MTEQSSSTTPASRVLALAVPLMASNLSQTLLSITDTMMVGRLDDSGAGPLAAMGAAGILFLVMFLFLTATFLGVQVLTARRFGEGDFDECGRILDCGLVISTVVGVIAGIAGIFLAHDVTNAIFSDGVVADQAADYLNYRWGGILTLCTLWTFKGFYYGVGFTKIDMVLTLSMNVANVGLNFLFIYGSLGAPEMGMPGAGLSSVLATGGACLIYIVLSLRPAFREKYKLFRPSHWSSAVAGKILRLSGPRAMQAAAFGGCIIFFKLIENHCGEIHLAASTVVWKSFGIPVLLALGLGSAAATLVGQSLGAGKPDDAELYARTAVRIGVLISGVLAVCVWIFPEIILRAFTDKPDVIDAGRGPMRLMATFQMADTVGIILSRALSGAGCIFFVMLSEICIQFLIVMPAAFLLTHFFPENLTVVWLTWALYMFCWFASMAWKFKQGTWKSIVV